MTDPKPNETERKIIEDAIWRWELSQSRGFRLIDRVDVRGIALQAMRGAVEKHAALVKAAEHVEDILGFYEGSEEKIRYTLSGQPVKDGNPVVQINAQGPEGDFQTMLAMTRDALAGLKDGGK